MGGGGGYDSYSCFAKLLLYIACISFHFTDTEQGCFLFAVDIEQYVGEGEKSTNNFLNKK